MQPAIAERRRPARRRPPQIPVREPEVQKHLMSQLTGWLADGQLKPVVGRVFALEDFRDAFRTMQTRGALGKMVVRISK
ncbi:zinc-binding dehydrogenase [Bradyrhizobium sp. 62B]|uniref:zinc-binding dehydrogenase n=1 Tax=Bradyrhizobium sp. 62B TaxID=2898442 RepID=UPI002557FA87|nr:zinc-binding dehydrogenase [Bradyrhizobium sp. 62B]